MNTLDTLTKARLSNVSTATLTTALFKRGFRNVFLQGLKRLGAKKGVMVGQAFTLRYIPAREDLDGLSAFDDRTHPQRVAIETCPPGHVLVMDSRGDPSAASSGGILLARLIKRGVEGVVTDGGFRDTPEIANMDIAAYHQRPSAPTNLIKHHAVDLQLPIACGSVAIYPGDVIVGDAEGVVCIPAAIASELAIDAYEQTIYEDWVETQIAAGEGLFGVYPLTDDAMRKAFIAWKQSNAARYPFAQTT